MSSSPISCLNETACPYLKQAIGMLEVSTNSKLTALLFSHLQPQGNAFCTLPAKVGRCGSAEHWQVCPVSHLRFSGETPSCRLGICTGLLCRRVLLEKVSGSSSSNSARTNSWLCLGFPSTHMEVLSKGACDFQYT